MTTLALAIALPLLMVLAIVLVAARRGLQLRLLVEDGVETEGRVVARIKHTGSTYQAQKRLRYEYRDGHGERHEHVSLVPDSLWNQHPRGTSIAIVYARRKSHVSAPLYLVRQAREAVERDD